MEDRTPVPTEPDAEQPGRGGRSMTSSSASATPSPSITSPSRSAEGEFFSLPRPVGLWQDHDAAVDRRLRRAGRGPDHAVWHRHRRACPRIAATSTRCFQSYALFPHLSVWDNIAFGLRRKKRAKAEIAQAGPRTTSNWSSSTGMEQRRPGQLSGGQQQRVALARALIERTRRAAARRTARRARPQAAQADAARAHAHPA